MDIILEIDQHRVGSEVIAKYGRHRDEIYLSHFGDEIIWQAREIIPQTSYHFFHRLITQIPLNSGDTVVDMGMGFGRLGFVIGATRPELNFKGYEIVSERVIEANRVHQLMGLPPSIEFLHQDLADPNFKLPDAKLYWAYNPVSAQTGNKLWLDLIKKAKAGKEFYFVGSMNFSGVEIHDLIEKHFPRVRESAFMLYKSRP